MSSERGRNACSHAAALVGEAFQHDTGRNPNAVNVLQHACEYWTSKSHASTCARATYSVTAVGVVALLNGRHQVLHGNTQDMATH